jgi:hypothetical protein
MKRKRIEMKITVIELIFCTGQMGFRDISWGDKVGGMDNRQKSQELEKEIRQ